MGLGIKTRIQKSSFLIIGFAKQACLLGDSFRFWKKTRESVINWKMLAIAERFPFFTSLIANKHPERPKIKGRFALIRRQNRNDIFIQPTHARLLPDAQESLKELSITLSGSDCIDIGAHAGTFALLLAESGARVLAFEPDPENFELLKQNISIADQNIQNSVKIFNKAVLSKNGKQSFYIGPSSTSGALMGAATRIIPRNEKQKILVDVISLRSIFDDNQIEQCTLLKIDIEGAEYEALQKLDPVYFTRIQNMLIEIHPVDGQDATSLISYVLNKGYKHQVLRKGETGCLDVWFQRNI